ncbi:MAG: hypothetical protein Q9160_005217 [Pyrenula sp. 1 TL-2023]
MAAKPRQEASDGPRLPSESLGHDLTTVFVGEKRKKICIHKALICEKSEFFERALNGQFEEAKSNEVYFPDDDPMAFELLVYRLYRGKLPDDANAITGISEFPVAYVHYYVLVDKLLFAPRYKTEVLNVLKTHYIRGRTGGIHMDAVAETIKLTASDCPLRQLVLDLACWSFLCFAKSDEWLETCFKDAPVSDLVAFLKSVKLMIGSKDANKMLERYGLVARTSVGEVERYQVGYLKETEWKLSVHTDLLCKESTFFRKALKGSFVEAAENVVRFPDDNGPYDIAAFELFVSALYIGNLPGAFTTCCDEHVMRTIVCYDALIDRLLVGDVYKIEVLNIVLNKTRDWEVPIHATVVADTLATTADDCPFRRLILDFACVSYVFLKANKNWLEICFGNAAPGTIIGFVEEVKEGGTYGTVEDMRQSYGIYYRDYEEDEDIDDIERYQIGFLKKDRQGNTTCGEDNENSQEGCV